MQRSLRMPKVQVEILLPNGDSIKVKRKIEGDRVVIEDSARGKTGWKPQFDKDCIVNERRGFLKRSRRQKLFVKFGAEKCISFPSLSIPSPDAKTIASLFDAQVLKNAGRSILKVSVPLPVYLLLMAILVLSVLSFLSGRGITIMR